MIINPYISFPTAAYTARTTAFATATGISDATILTALSTFDTGLIANSLDTKMKAVYPFVGGTSTTCKYNFFNPLDTDAAYRMVFGGGFTFSSTGILGNAINNYANTKLNLFSVFGNNNYSFSYYSRTNSAVTTMADMGADAAPTGAQMEILTRAAGDIIYIDVPNFSPSRISTTNTNSSGLFSFTNDSVIGRNLYRNGSSLITAAYTSSNLPNYELYFTNWDSVGSIRPSNRELAFASASNALTNGENVIFYNLVQAFQTSLSRQV